MRSTYSLLALGALALAACTAPDGVAPSDVSLAASSATLDFPEDDGSNPDMARVAALVDRINDRLARGGSKLRVDEVSMFTVGRGTDPFRRLRTGSRWANPNVTYMIKESRILATAPNGAPAPSRTVGQTVAEIVKGWEVWNGVGSTLRLTRIPDAGGNIDVLDAMWLRTVPAPTPANPNATAEVCDDVVDLGPGTRVTSYNPPNDINFTPAADNVFGGWLDPRYFALCLGSGNIIGVTWSFSDVDSENDGDRYRDRLYTEMFYNPRFRWVTAGSPFLSSVMDVSTIVAHEAGHAHGLGHFGGPNANQPFKLQPNGRVFDPEAVMNPFYIGGTKYQPLPSDVAATRALYQSDR
ncbi:MAG TPA: hypothetical protein VNA89_01320 [Gemmatimonadaceae bacterium]|nr:hypothetical protein [Gemmatimonadaceae bacterium]